jgi:hypothetical protein
MSSLTLHTSLVLLVLWALLMTKIMRKSPVLTAAGAADPVADEYIDAEQEDAKGLPVLTAAATTLVTRVDPVSLGNSAARQLRCAAFHACKAR